MKPVFKKLEVGPLLVNCLLVGAAASQQVAVIDPGDDADRILAEVQRLGAKVSHILATHGHFDHIGGVASLQEATGAPFWIHRDDLELLEQAKHHAASWGLPFGRTPRVDRYLEDNEQVQVAGLAMQVLHTPGHTRGGVCLLWDGAMAVGDTLFAGSIGRTDLPGGNHAQLIHSITTRLMPLPGQLLCHPGHGPGTTIGRERDSNPFFGRR